jgi:hypothetical protein
MFGMTTYLFHVLLAIVVVGFNASYAILLPQGTGARGARTRHGEGSRRPLRQPRVRAAARHRAHDGNKEDGMDTNGRWMGHQRLNRSTTDPSPTSRSAAITSAAHR